jgi:hypothetical protein
MQLIRSGQYNSYLLIDAPGAAIWYCSLRVRIPLQGSDVCSLSESALK